MMDDKNKTDLSPQNGHLYDVKTKKLGKTLYKVGNKGGDYLMLSELSKEQEDNRLYLEIGSCCVVNFKGIVTIEMITGLLTNLIFKHNAPLHIALKKEMQESIAKWDDAVIDEFTSLSEEVDLY
jgi:hypothetical protein